MEYKVGIIGLVYVRLAVESGKHFHAVSHKEFKDLDWHKIRNAAAIIFDVKSTLDKNLVGGRL